MGKKSKKKTLASTRKNLNLPAKPEKQPFWKKLFKKSDAKPARKKEKAEIPPVEQTAVMTEKSEKVEEPAAPQNEKKLKLPKLPPLSNTEKQKLTGLILVVIGTVLLTVVGGFLWGKIFRPSSLAEYLPAGTSIGFAEVNIDGSSSQPQQLFKLFAKDQVYQPGMLTQLISTFLPVDYKRDLEPWLGRKMGVALLEQPDQNSVIMVLLVESKNIARTMEFLKSRILTNSEDELISENYNGSTIYSYKLSQNYNFLFLNNYLAVSTDRNVLKQLADTRNNSVGKLKDEGNFIKIEDNLPQGALGFSYVNFQKLYESISKNPLFDSPKARDLLALQPFIKIFSAEGGVLFANDKQLSVQTFTAINRKQLEGATYLTFNDRYQGKLLELADEQPIVLMGGHDLYKELMRLEEIFKGTTGTSNLIFEGLLEAQKQQYLGKDISLVDDVYPLLKGEYLLTVENSLEQPRGAIMLKFKDKANDVVRFEKLVSAFIKTGAIFSPHVQEVTLPDGTKGQEIVASPEQIMRIDAEYEGTNLITLKLGDLPWEIDYTYLDDTLVVTTNPEILHNIIDRSVGKLKTNLRNNEFFRNHIEPVLRTADEVVHLKLGAFTSALGLNDNPVLKPYIEPFTNLTFTKNFFDDGISTIYLIDVI